ncbi:hypothetical protein ED312_08710 [Sinomicrobium pectinilyticum]|uniref:Methylamine utilisation protein MauE domain-containing protein n=1 Tax=Sinomicrobium pectinilyticum TaxID=1084421 RepID=A0A3N0EKW0_SINP1|nr:MauE/DoxX family redox-associated membrane protein [Sinomicrobium pectinilyticum]RNL88518.1 hypothetical protein ED312_08710 [Sinomicrobium pectinilyticum]
MKLFKPHKQHIVSIICLLFVILFVYAACTKLLDYEKFRVQVGQSPVLTSIGGWISWLVPGIELVIAFMFIIPRLRLLALYASLSLMVMFTAYIFIVLNYSSFVPCSCGGILEKMGWTEHLFFNIGFVFLAMIGILLLEKSTNHGTSSPIVISEVLPNDNIEVS